MRDDTCSYCTPLACEMYNYRPKQHMWVCGTPHMLPGDMKGRTRGQAIVQQRDARQLAQALPREGGRLHGLLEGAGKLRVRARRVQRGHQQVAGAGGLQEHV